MLKHGVMAAAFLASGVLATTARGADVGDIAPEIQAERWYNAPGPMSLAQLRGRVVVVEFWATYCGPCHAVQPKLAAIHERLGPKGMVLISMSDEPDAFVAPFISRKPASYIISSGGDTPRRYGIKGIPAAFVIDRNGVIAWRGNPHEGGFEEAIERTMQLSGPQKPHANADSGAAAGFDELDEVPPSSRGSTHSATNSPSSSQRPFEAGAARPAKEASVAKKSSRPAAKSARSKQKGGNRTVANASKTSRKTATALKSKRATGKAKSAKLVKKSPPARKPAKRSKRK